MTDMLITMNVTLWDSRSNQSRMMTNIRTKRNKKEIFKIWFLPFTIAICTF